MNFIVFMRILNDFHGVWLSLETYDQLEKLQTVFFALSDGLKETDPNQIKEVLRQVSEMELKGPPFFEIYIARRVSRPFDADKVFCTWVLESQKTCLKDLKTCLLNVFKYLLFF